MSDPYDPRAPEFETLDDPQHDEQDIALDPAQQSLADALRITYRFIQIVMVALVVLFVGSGFDTVGEGQRGIELLFGKISGSTSNTLEPGRHFHWPYPVGELVKVSVGQRTLRLDSSFMPDLTENQKSRPLETLSGMFPTLKPGQDGSLITGDGNIAHAQWTVVYSVEDPTAFATIMHPENTARIVQFVIERAAVYVLAELPVDGFLGQTSSVTSNSTIEAAVRSSAQQSFDTMRAGLRIDRVTLDQRIPPLSIYDEFQSVSTSESEAIKAREEASQKSREALTNIAGLAHEEILKLIDDYELALSANNDAQADQILAAIDNIMDPTDTTTGKPVSGLVSEIISNARRYRTDVVTTAQADAERFQAKLAQFRTNPDVFIATEWTSAYLEFLDFASAEIFPIPPGSDTLEIILNSDPDIVADLERKRNTSQAVGTMQSRLKSVLQGYSEDERNRKIRELQQDSQQ